MKILFIADIFGRPGRNVVKKNLPDLLKKYKIDFCIANCENAASGRGITEKTALELFDSGIDVLTSGNHLWDKKESLEYIKKEKRIIKPSNYPSAAYGNRVFFKQINNKPTIAVANLCGQAFMSNIDSPFKEMNILLNEMAGYPIKIIDFHAESTAEKRCFGFYFDGKISAMFGTHTHIQTADEEILPNGTAYITDVGMTGPHDSIIGVKKEIIFSKTITGMPIRYQAADSGLQINAIFCEFDIISGKTIKIERVREKYDD